MRELLSTTGSAELVYWLAFLRIEDERRAQELDVFGSANLLQGLL